MIIRNLNTFLTDWKQTNSRMPLIIRGARQVGKTTLVNYFGQDFDQYLYFNLEKSTDLQLFENLSNLPATVQLLFLSRNKIEDKKRSTLIFIDEIQEKPEVISSLRYFHEDYPHLHVIVSGSLLEFALEKQENVPVGRVEYAELHPLNFEEYLRGDNSDSFLDLLKEVPLKNELLPLFFDKFHTYAMIGGMPKITYAYLKEQNLSRTINLYSGLITAYKSDIEKYSKSTSQKEILRHIIDTAPFEIDNRIKLENFGGSRFKSREVKSAFSALEKAKILELYYPTTNTGIPAIPNFEKRPRLCFLDVGLVNFQLGLHKELLNIKDLNDSSRGKLVQQIVMQELKSINYLPNKKLNFWVREEHGTSSEIDLVYPYKNFLIPIEIKSGATGTLRSLHEYIDRCDHHYAVRLYGGKINIDTLFSKKGKEYKLLNLPYFLAAWIDKYLDWFINEN